MSLPTPYYDRDGITVFCAKAEDVLPTLGRFDLLLTDPPFGIYSKGGKWGRKAQLTWDREAPEIGTYLEAADNAIVWGGNYWSLRPSRGWLVWHKRDSVPSAADAELAWTTFDSNTRVIDCTIAETNSERIGHPTQKPLKVMRESLSYAERHGGAIATVLDPFGGSLTTAVACKLAGVQCTIIEQDEDYCRKGVERLRQGVLEFADA